jgi:MFS family permease
MSWLHRVRHRLYVLRRGERYAEEQAREVSFHLELTAMAEPAHRRGDYAAELSARRVFGNVTYYREETRRMSPLGMIDRIRQDLSYAGRGLRRSPGFTAGVVVDRTDKLRLVKIAQALLGLEAAALWWFTWSGHITIGVLLALATANGLITAFEVPARQSLVIELVGREDLPGAIALNSSGFNLARIVGPSIGAIIIAGLGISWCFGVNALSYITVLVGLFLIRLPEWVPPEHLVSPIEGIREGVRFVRDTPSIAALMKLVTVY